MPRPCPPPLPVPNHGKNRAVREWASSSLAQARPVLYTLLSTQLPKAVVQRWWAWGSEFLASSHMRRELVAAELQGRCVRPGGFPFQALGLLMSFQAFPDSSSCPPWTSLPAQQQPEAAPAPRGVLKSHPARPKPRSIIAESEGGARLLRLFRVF